MGRHRVNFGDCSEPGCTGPAKVGGMCYKHYQRRNRANKGIVTTTKADKPSQKVYALTAPWVPDGLLRIGHTTSPDKRIANYRAVLPGAEFARLYDVPSALTGERAAHRALEARLVDLPGTREWFRVTPEELDEVVATILKNWDLLK
jgi:hypothetical protein